VHGRGNALILRNAPLKGLPDVYSSLQPTLKAKINLRKQGTRQSLEELRTGLRSKLDTKLGRGFLCYE